MNEYTYDEIDLSNNYRASFSVEVTDEMMISFMKLTGDKNPLYIDEGFVASQGYPGRVVYGMLSASLYSTLAGMYLPGKYSLLQRVDTHFHKPVFIGDKLTVLGYIKKRLKYARHWF